MPGTPIAIKPFSPYCNTPAANAQLPTPSTGAGTSDNSHPDHPEHHDADHGSADDRAPERNAAPGDRFHRGVAARRGQAAFTAAQADLKAGNLAGYQTNVEKAQTLVQQAQQLAAKKP